MKVLVTGGTGVIGRATIVELLRRGHAVRLLSRGAEEDVGAWDGPVEAHPGDVGDASSITGAADGCDAVIHIVGIVEEAPPEATFQRINVDGTQHIVAEAARAGVRRLIHVSSLGAQRGRSDYHRSKMAAEAIVTSFAGEWCIVRTGAVAGRGDETVSVLLRMMRTLPAVPIVGSGDQSFQPVWHEDVAWALAECVERGDDVVRRVLNVTGADVLTVTQLLDLFAEVIDRDPPRVPVPELLAKAGSFVAEALRVEAPVSSGTLQMLLEGNFLRDGEANDLTGLLGMKPEPIRNRLVQLVDQPPEQTPEQGVGKLQRRRFHADIHGARDDAGGLSAMLQQRFQELVPFDGAAEPGAPTTIREGATLTLELPARGHVQVRAEHVDETSFTLATLDGHPLAGVVRFHFDDRDDGVVRFTIDVVERAASRLDQLAMTILGSAAQKRTWMVTVENVVEQSGGTAPDGVVEQSWALDDQEAEPLERWVKDLVRQRQRRAGTA
ncbi:MAG: DUF1990 family protein [Gemmatimonadota bacterium]